ncbi:MAG TPA: metallophosphoesterase [Thermoanaerobaculia bacterium]|nr:metallophosphoesterase [Thermoanaerobaculia bacterium]
MHTGDKLRIAAVGDIHTKTTSQGAFRTLFTAVNEAADVLLLCGDLTDFGLREEAEILAREIQTLRVPVLAVLGNHDLEADRPADLVHILRDAGVVMLDGDSHEIEGVGFAGIKGFGGGFGRRALGSFGEKTIKQFVHESVEESLKLESALSRLRTPQKIAVLHYAPISATVQGEPPEIYPFLGSSRLEDVLDRYRVDATFHGHAHYGSGYGQTKRGSPVFNVAMHLLMRENPEQPPFKIFEVPTPVAESSSSAI